jgi:hypothetical protein
VNTSHSESLPPGGRACDGRLFFSRSPLRSARFVGVTGAGLVCIALVVFVLYRGWHRLLFVGVSAIAVIGYTIVGLWWRSWRCIARIREVYATESMEKAKLGSQMDILLGVAADLATDLLFFSFGIIALLLVLVAVLL